MHVVARSNDLVRLSFLTALLSDAGIEAVLLDGHASATEGSISAIPRRLVVAGADAPGAETWWRPPMHGWPRPCCGTPAKPDPVETTAGTLLGGRVIYAQPQTGYRTGIEPVLLAASIPARPGERVIEGGTGAGAALLCLASRVAGLTAMGVERDFELAALAEANARANGFGGLSVRAADLLALTGLGPVDHVMANPPWHLADSAAAADLRRDAAKRGRPGLIGRWTVALAAMLRHRGTLTLIVPARASAEALGALEAAGCGSPALLPLWPAAGREARIVLVQAIRGGRGGARILPGLVLHDGPQRYSPAAEAILRHGDALRI